MSDVECIVMGDDIKNHSRDPRYVDLCAAILLLAFVGLALIVIDRAMVIEPTRSVGVDHYVRW